MPSQASSETHRGRVLHFAIGIKRLNSQRVKDLDIFQFYYFKKSDRELFQDRWLFQKGVHSGTFDFEHSGRVLILNEVAPAGQA